MTSTRYRFNLELYNELSSFFLYSFIYILLKSTDIFELRLKNQNQSVNDHNFSETNDDDNNDDDDDDYYYL